MGLRGICIDPLEESEARFRELRPEDSFTRTAIGETKERKALRVYADDAASSLDAKTMDRYDKKFEVRETRSIEMNTLLDVLEAKRATDYSIPFINIDVEGMDEVVFKQVLGLEHRPMLICVENKLANMNTGYPSTTIDGIAKRAGFSLVSKTLLNSFFIDRESETFDWIPKAMTTLESE